ncbi:MAG: hypothetical protein II842_17385 [Butyrivibrio sp.]|nr:hypothetical protein [Butyrivibrio sp.]
MDITVSVAGKLKELVDNNGPRYLAENPYGVYRELVNSGSAEKKTAGAVMLLLTTDIMETLDPKQDPATLSKQIQKECCFNKKMSDLLSDIVLLLHSDENEEDWKDKDVAGLERFRKEKLPVEWDGFSTWQVSGGGVDCFYNAAMVLKPTAKLVINEELTKGLKKNPFMKTDAIRNIYVKNLKAYLDREFEEYCTCDDYYQPVVEDFELESYVNDWCKKNGFKIISCEGEGDDSGFEPDSVRRWIKYR